MIDVSVLYKEFTETNTLYKESINLLFQALAEKECPKEIIVKDTRAEKLLSWLNKPTNNYNITKSTGLLNVYSSYLIKVCRCFLEEKPWDPIDDSYAKVELEKWITYYKTTGKLKFE